MLQVGEFNRSTIIVQLMVQFVDALSYDDKNMFFVYFSTIEDFDSFWNKIAHVSNRDTSSGFKMAKVSCKFNKKICDEQNINELLVLKYFASDSRKFDYNPMMEFLNKTVQEALENVFAEEASLNAINSGNCFIKFHVKYCTYCKKMMPVWSEIEKTYENNKDVKVFNIDCKLQPRVCDLYNITKYPSVIWFSKGEMIDKYSGQRKVIDLKEYIGNMLQRFSQPLTLLEKQEKEAIVEETATIEMTADIFFEVIAKDFTFVYFFMEKCTYCQELNEVWDKLAQRFASTSNVKIARMDCNLYASFCLKESRGCPTLNLYKDGLMLAKDYHEDYSIENLYQCVSSYVKGGKGQYNKKKPIGTFLNEFFQT